MTLTTQGCRFFIRTKLLLTAIILFTVVPASVSAGVAKYVIEISVDGGGSSYIQTLIDQALLPNFKKFETEGAWTNNARNDHDITVTLPNHVTMVTGRGVYGVNNDGHMWTSNSDPSTDPTASHYSIQNNKGSYVYSVFDVANDNGLRTALYATKTKFSLFDHSYNNGNGAIDTTGYDNGVNKIDAYIYNSSSSTITTNLIETMKSDPFNYVLVHFTDGDSAGHSSGWGSTAYNNALIAVDGYLGRIFDLVMTTPALQGKTDIILTADHGGKGTDHSLITEPLNYTVPFYVWGPDAEAGVNLYSVNPSTRLDPGTTRPPYTESVQPIRNGELANLALRILELGAVQGSTIDQGQNLAIASPYATGECGSDNGRELASAPVNLCNKGVASAISGTGPWSWTCTNGGSSAPCVAIVLSLPFITTASPLPSGTVGMPYGATFSVTGGTSPYIWSLFSGTLPAGLTLSQSGVISGMPTVAGLSTCTIKVTDASGYSFEKTFDVTIIAPLQITTVSPLPSATKKLAYSTKLAATGGASPYTWVIFSGKLPSGLSLNSTTGVVSGKAAKSGTSVFTVKVSDNKGAYVSKELSLTVK